MAVPYQNFRSSTQINVEREGLREAREAVLKKVKSDYEKAEKRREKARLAGEGTWMLSSVSDRIEKEQKSDDEPKWIEKGGDEPAPKDKPVAGPTLQRDDWMAAPLVTDIIPTAANLLEQPGQHSRELNPYWKGGGTGLPENKPTAAATPPVAAGDGGLSWLRKAYDRCKQQAKDEGRSLEDIAAERYGSLEKLESMIREAEGTRGQQKGGNYSGRGGYTQRPSRDERRRPRSRSRSPPHRDSRDRAKNSDRDDWRRDDDRRSGRDDRNGDRRRRGSDSDDGETKRDRRPRDNYGSSSSHDSHREGDRRADRPRFMRPREDGGDEREAPRSRRTFMKPGDDPDGGQRVSSSSSLKGRFARPVDSDEEGDSSSSSDSSSSESEVEEQAPSRDEAPPVRILSEDEMNALGAKILRAELMGDEDLAQQLKTQLEQAQKAKEAGLASRPQGSQGAAGKIKDDDDKVVVLTRTGRDGMVRPLPEQDVLHDSLTVETHAKGGERTRYFDDDDKHDLKTLVQMEKLGTAEDQNMMFARLAGRSAEQTNDDFQVDDVFLSKAARQQSAAKAEEKERSKAIFEHRKVSVAMDKCQFCFSKVPKHLIIAIGSKVYLSLPAHRSLTPGHCLIVPMQHVSAATALDEDVWQEIQMFRKALVRMFKDQDQDLVVMETSMHLKHFPHMCIECVPLEQEVGDLAPIYFKKAVMEAGPEWASNKKLVDLSKKDVRHSVPKGFPYFSVDFGLQGGYAHVIEDEKSFPAYFGREIVGGMIDAEPTLWRKPHREGFEDQRRKVLEFEQWWKPYDWTQQLNKDG
ncbi:hypothetical protein BaRGS_00013534 [Batillaria attramentaria]|uniref:CWF19-like protein 2 n=1 Tax=Batillaria attramentaria TaxID=370345 RepID=A0ABD0L6Y5_9CAEN